MDGEGGLSIYGPNLYPLPFGFSLSNLGMFQGLVQGLCSPFLGVFIMDLLPVRVSSKSLLLSIAVSLRTADLISHYVH